MVQVRGKPNGYRPSLQGGQCAEVLKNPREGNGNVELPKGKARGRVRLRRKEAKYKQMLINANKRKVEAS